MEKHLDCFVQKEVGYVKKIEAEGKIKRRLFDMGVTPGTVIKLKKVAPLGDPIEISIRGYELSLRKDEAHKVLMEVEKLCDLH